MSWKKTIQTIEPQSKSWRDSISTIEEQPSELESLLRGAAQGASFGFSDEITGAIESLLTDKDYETARDESRTNNKAAQEANPFSYGTGEIGAALGTTFIPGVGALNAGKAATFAGRAGLAAAQGGLTGAGMSEAEDASGIVKDTAIGAATGAAMQGIGEKVIAPAMSKAGQFIKNKVLDKADDAVNYGLQKAGRVMADVPEADTARYLSNPEAVNKSMTIGELGEDLLNNNEDSLLKQMYQRASDFSSDAWNTLDSKKTVSNNSLRQSIADIQDSLLTDGVLLGDNQTRAYQKLAALSESIKQLPQDIPEPTMKRIIQNLDSNINWNDPNAKVVNDAFKDVRGFVDNTLKTQNTAYKSAMEKTADITDSIQTVKSAFQNRQNPENFDKFLKSVKNLDKKSEHSSVNQALDKIKEHTGYDLREQILNSQAKSAFMKDSTNGSRKTLTGALVGSAAGSVMGPLGVTVGGAVGGAAGAVGDKYAGRIFKSILNGKISATEGIQSIAPQLGKYAEPLMNAAKQSNKSLAATMFILQQRDPSFRELMKDDQED